MRTFLVSERLTMSTVELRASTPYGSASAHTSSLRDCVKHAVRGYLSQLDGQNVTNVYNLVLNEIEEALLHTMMQFTEQNQSKAAAYLGLSRGTLRKKLEQYGMLISAATRNHER